MFYLLILFYSMFSLPQSSSGFGTLDGIDLMKIARLAAVAFIGAFCTQIAAVPDLGAVSLNLVLQDAAAAGLMAVGAAAVEAFRRLLTDNTAQ